ncbi:hypothetical protein LIER_30954 [Lithospermum erythrorhizon]|uniref:Uncharacterized protein n=1 Tax=Lithospermum erythrorhizon TaxID=34254 RepID=A0AAV3RPG0_LITER
MSAELPVSTRELRACPCCHDIYVLLGIGMSSASAISHSASTPRDDVYPSGIPFLVVDTEDETVAGKVFDKWFQPDLIPKSVANSVKVTRNYNTNHGGYSKAWIAVKNKDTNVTLKSQQVVQPENQDSSKASSLELQEK